VISPHLATGEASAWEKPHGAQSSLFILKKINLSVLSSKDGTLINAMPKSLGTEMK